MHRNNDIERHRLLTCAAMADADRQTIANGYASGAQLMENAGYAILDIILQRFGDAPCVHILCGPGNNGGDGYVVGRLLAERGHTVRIYALGAPKDGTDGQQAAVKWPHGILEFSAFEPDENDLVVDAIFGAGARGKLPQTVVTALAKASSPTVRLLAVDLPSGVDGDTGHARYYLAYDATVTFHRKKPGHVMEPGRTLCGDVIVADIGVRADVKMSGESQIYENHPALWQPAIPPLAAKTHKYLRGHVGVFSGPVLSTGAARLSAMAAQKTGAGAVTLIGSWEALQVHSTHVTSAMLRACEDPNAAINALNELNNCTSVVLGPGFVDLNTARKIALHVIKQADQALVLDADGLTAFANNSEDLFRSAKNNTKAYLVLTPHEGEFARLFPDLAGNDAISKIDKAVIAAERSNAVLVYKGSDTVIAAPTNNASGCARVVVNTNAPPSLATAGSGDVLTGVIAGLVSRGMPIFEAAAAAVWMHGEAGRRAGPWSDAEVLLVELPATLEFAMGRTGQRATPLLEYD